MRARCDAAGGTALDEVTAHYCPVKRRGRVDAALNPFTARGVLEVEVPWILGDNASMRNMIEVRRARDCKRCRVHENQIP